MCSGQPGPDSITRGTYMHLNIEKALNGAPADVALPELQQFQTLQLEVRRHKRFFLSLVTQQGG